MGKLDSIEFLKIRILVSLLKMSPENCNVTNLSKTLGVEKYTVSPGIYGAGEGRLFESHGFKTSAA